VFPNWQGNPEKLQNVYRRCWYTLQEEVGFVDEEVEPKYPLKDLRHVGASMEIDNGANLKEIAMLMGHASVKIIYDVYEQFVPGKNKIPDFSGLQACPVGLKILVSVVQIRPWAPFKIKHLAAKQLNSPVKYSQICPPAVTRRNPRLHKWAHLAMCPICARLSPVSRLELQGYAHFLAREQTEVHLYYRPASPSSPGAIGSGRSRSPAPSAPCWSFSTSSRTARASTRPTS
jgi:hypothetical protein